MQVKRFRIAFLCLIFFSVSVFMSNVSAYVPNTSDVTFIPCEIDNVLNNPYTGWAPNAKGTYPQPHKLVYAKVTWRELEPVKGVIDFNTFESLNKFAYWKSKDVRIILRIILDYPRSYQHMDIPDWLYQEINGDGTYYDISYGKGFSPNYNNSLLISYHRELINKLAQRYNNDPSIAMVALGSIGHWGEFHTYKSSTFTIPFPDIGVVNQYVNHYSEAFDKKLLMMRRPHQIALDKKMGLYNDTFGVSLSTQKFIDWFNNGYKFWLTGELMPAMPDFWKYAPSGGELGNAPGLEYLQDSTISATLQQAIDSHTSWIGPCCPANLAIGNSIQHNMDALLKTMGYRFILQSETHPYVVHQGDSMPVNMVWNNKGSAPFYYPWPLELSISDSSGNILYAVKTPEDIRLWLPGTKISTCYVDIPSNLAPGEYTLCAAILDPDKGVPSVDLAITGKRTDGRYSLGKFSISLNTTTTVQPTNTMVIKDTPTAIVTPVPTATNKVRFKRRR